MKILAVCAFVVLLFTSCKNSVGYETGDPVYRTGDSMEWASLSYADQQWSSQRGAPNDSILWVRNNVLIRSRTDTTQSMGMEIHSFGAFEVYWDGVYIGRNGRPQTPGLPEQQGTEASSFLIPDTLAHPGNHLVALRMTQVYAPKAQRGVDIKLQNYSQLLRLPLIILSFMNLMAGAFLIAALYYFFLFINSRRNRLPALIFAIICTLFCTLHVIEYSKFYIDIPYGSFYVRLEAIGWLTFLIAFLVPMYFTIQFSVPFRKFILPIIPIVLLIVYGCNFHHYDVTAIYYSYTMWTAIFIIVGYAAFKKQKGAWLVLAGVVASVVINFFLLYDFVLFISFTIIVLCMMYLHAIRTQVIEDEHQASLLLSSRLQLELLKKNIQPHFIRNTLTSMIDWVEESPKDGAEFIQSLAGEFDILSAIADETLIPVRQEIDLCRRHLSVMQFRKELRYEWAEHCIDENETIPPAILHTLLENGITHSIPSKDGTIGFQLSFEKTDHFKKYTFEVFAENRAVIPGRKGGNGLKYITARLKESYGSNWAFSSIPTNTGWQSIITINKGS